MQSSSDSCHIFIVLCWVINTARPKFGSPHFLCFIVSLTIQLDIWVFVFLIKWRSQWEWWRENVSFHCTWFDELGWVCFPKSKVWLNFSDVLTIRLRLDIEIMNLKSKPTPVMVANMSIWRTCRSLKLNPFPNNLVRVHGKGLRPVYSHQNDTPGCHNLWKYSVRGARNSGVDCNYSNIHNHDGG